MGNFSELSSIKQWGILALGAVLLTECFVLHRVQQPRATAKTLPRKRL